MAATTYVSSPWKAAVGTSQDKVVGLTHDGTNFVVVYRYK